MPFTLVPGTNLVVSSASTACADIMINTAASRALLTSIPVFFILILIHLTLKPFKN